MPEVSLTTHHVMQANKSKNTKPELEVRRALREAGLSGYRLHWKKAPGKPDICYPGRRVAIFVNGCFWHRCPHCNLALPKTNVEFWREKFARNQSRDARDNAQLVAAGWTVIVVWECRLKKGRFDRSMAQIETEVRACERGGHRPGRVVEVGSPPAWWYRRAFVRSRARH